MTSEGCRNPITLRLATALLFLVVIPTITAGQAVRGRVAGLGGQPAPGVVVILEDSVGAPVRRSITGSDGRFAIDAPGVGHYSLRTLRLGFRPAHFALPTMAAGRDTLLVVMLEPVPLQLARVVVRARRTCDGLADNGRAAELWGLVRTALEGQALTAASVSYAMSTRISDVEMDLRGNPTGPRSTRRRDGPAVQPFVSTPPESLAAEGYVRGERGPVDWRAIADRGTDGDLVYRGPDATVLLSDRFARDHCFELVASADPAQAELGLAFRPARPSRAVVDIRGVMWVDRQSSELRRIIFSYDPIPEEIGADIGGSIRYAALPTGGWVLTEWEIRMPLVNRTSVGVPDGGMGRMRTEWRLVRAGTRLTRGEVLEVRHAGAPVWTQLDGRLVMRIAPAENGSAARGRVRVGLLATADDTAKSASAMRSPRLLTPDSLGQYQVRGLPRESELRVLLWNLIADSLAIAPETLAVAARGAADTSTLSLRAPGVADVVRRLCGTVVHDSAMRAVVGVVRDAAGAEMPNVEVQAGFVGVPREVAPGRFMARSEARAARTDSSGRFVICAVPTALPVTIRAHDARRESEPLIVRVPAHRAYAIAGIVLPTVGEVDRP